MIIKRALVNEFTEFLNSVHPSIKFTVELEKDNMLAMLDVMIHRNQNGTLYFTVYRKPTHTNQYLNFQSHQPLQHKLGVVRTLRDRADRAVTNEEDKHKEYNTIKESLAVAGYPEWTWGESASKKKLTRNTPHVNTSRNLRITLPYIQGTSEAIARHMRKNGIQVHFKPHVKLRNLLVAPKDKTVLRKKCNTVYHIKCNDCDAHYVGETERPVGVREKEHKIRGPVKEHLKRTSHEMSDADLKVLDNESDWTRRGIKEGYYIAEKKPDLNLDSGRYPLARAYNKLLP